MKSEVNWVAFVGPLPPPVHGFSVINQSMLREIGKRCKVMVFNRAPRVGARNQPENRYRAALRTPALFLRFCWFVLTHRPRTLYMPLSGGMGLLQDLPFAVFALVNRTLVYTHHHCFAYLDRPRWYSRIAFRLMRGSKHIVLCERMKSLLASRYAIPEEGITTLSNAAFLECIDVRSHQVQKRDFTIGFISNITEAKGIFTFMKLAQQLEDVGVPVSAIIAGPIAGEIQERFWSTFNTLKNAKYLGPIYGDDKLAFYSSLDVFVFPTTYENEAEPIVVLEAMRAGVTTLSNDRGCIGKMLRDGGGIVVPNGMSFTDFAFDWILDRMHHQIETQTEARKRNRAGFSLLRARATATLSLTINEISLTPHE